MRGQSVHEHVAAIGPDSLWASKAEKGQTLKEAGRATGYHRKSLVRLLRRPAGGNGGRGRPCSKRLAPFGPELVVGLERDGELTVTADRNVSSARAVGRFLRNAISTLR